MTHRAILLVACFFVLSACRGKKCHTNNNCKSCLEEKGKCVFDTQTNECFDYGSSEEDFFDQEPSFIMKKNTCPIPTPAPPPVVPQQPSSAPTPWPAFKPAPRPSPSSIPVPTPSPVPRPTPSPVPRPTPSPVPRPTPSPVPRPTPSPAPRKPPSPTTPPNESNTPSPQPSLSEDVIKKAAETGGKGNSVLLITTVSSLILILLVLGIMWCCKFKRKMEKLNKNLATLDRLDFSAQQEI